MRLGILTGGGDVPGLNSCIKAAATRITKKDMRCSVCAGVGLDCFITIRTILQLMTISL